MTQGDKSHVFRASLSSPSVLETTHTLVPIPSLPPRSRVGMGGKETEGRSRVPGSPEGPSCPLFHCSDLNLPPKGPSRRPRCRYSFLLSPKRLLSHSHPCLDRPGREGVEGVGSVGRSRFMGRLDLPLRCLRGSFTGPTKPSRWTTDQTTDGRAPLTSVSGSPLCLWSPDLPSTGRWSTSTGRQGPGRE